jgi:hypothetical protein
MAALWLAVWAYFPQDGKLHGPLLGGCTVVTFMVSLMWMNAAASELVREAAAGLWKCVLAALA